MTASQKLKSDNAVDPYKRNRPLTHAALASQIEAWLIVRTRPRRFVQPSALTLWRAARKRFGAPPVEAGEGE